MTYCATLSFAVVPLQSLFGTRAGIALQGFRFGRCAALLAGVGLLTQVLPYDKWCHVGGGPQAVPQPLGRFAIGYALRARVARHTLCGQVVPLLGLVLPLESALWQVGPCG